MSFHLNYTFSVLWLIVWYCQQEKNALFLGCPPPMSRWSCNHRWPTSFEASTAELPTFIFMSVFHFFRQKEETLYHNRLDDSRGQGMPHCVFHLFFISAYYLVCYTLLTVQIYGDMNMPFSIYYNMDESWSNVTMENPWGRLITSWTVITTTTYYYFSPWSSHMYLLYSHFIYHLLGF